MNDHKKKKLAYISASLTLLAACAIGLLVASFSDQILPILLGTVSVLFGPIVGVLYLIEVKKGVFKVEDEE